MTAPAIVTLSLVSHTNAGKTTLARTLLRRDVGTVRDAPHVTEFAEDHRLWRSAAGDELRLWDTPGFGDSARLVKRMRQQGTPLGWFLSEVWDRWRDRPFWGSQQALRHVRDATDVVLYLVNAAEQPQAAGYVAPEMDLLAWVGKPVIVLLNQLGEPRPVPEEAAELELWQRHLAAWSSVVAVLPMDAFARCWVQEGVLFDAVARALPADQRSAMFRLQQAWGQQQLETYGHSIRVLASTLARIGAARVPLDGTGVGAVLGRLKGSIAALWGAAPAAEGAEERARQALAVILDDAVRQGTAELIALHGLDGSARDEILGRVAGQIAVAARVDEGGAALLGGVLSGALVGLKADLATGGLSLGGGLLAGGILGALGAAGLARGLNVMRGGGPPWVGWSAEALLPVVEAAVLRYLAVAHFGRGRGQWEAGESPAHWRSQVAAALEPQQPQLQALWARRGTRIDAPDDEPALAAGLLPLLDQVLRRVLQQLYPDAWPGATSTVPALELRGAAATA